MKRVGHQCRISAGRRKMGRARQETPRGKCGSRPSMSGFRLVSLCLLVRYLMVTASSLMSIADEPSEPMEPN